MSINLFYYCYLTDLNTLLNNTSFLSIKAERPEPPRGMCFTLYSVTVKNLLIGKICLLYCLTECRFNKTGVSGLIEHREIPAELANYSVSQDISIDCMWNITVKPGYKV